MKHVSLVVALLSLFVLSSCATKGQTGAVGGAAARSLLAPRSSGWSCGGLPRRMI